MKNNFFEYNNLEWDTNYFNIDCSKLIINEIPDTSELLQQLKNFVTGTKFVTIINLDNKPSINRWLSQYTNAFLCDVNVQFIKEIDFNESIFFPNITIKNNKKYSEDIINIAKRSFKYSRFFNDENLNESKKSDIYVKWVENSFSKRDKFFLEFIDNYNCVGFILFSKKENFFRIELIAIDDSKLKQGIGTIMLTALNNYIFSREEKRYLLVGTQVNNIEAVNFYVKNGFRYYSCSSTYHCWNM